MIRSLQIRRELTDAEQKQLFEWEPDVFRGDEYGLQWRPADVHIVGYLDDAPISHVGMVTHHVKVGKQHCYVGGVGGVITVKSHQKQGWAAACLERARETLIEEFAVDYGFLFCQDRFVPFYGSLGWRLLPDKVTIDQPQGKVLAPVHSMVLEFDKPWPDGPVDIESLPW